MTDGHRKLCRIGAAHWAIFVCSALGGLAIYPYPKLHATRNLRLKSEAGAEFPEGHDAKFVWYFRLTTGF